MSKKPLFQELLRLYGPEKIINALAPHLTDKRKERVIPVLNQRLNSIQAAVEDPADMHNALAIVRTAEAMGLLHVHIIGKPKKREGKITMRGADRWTYIHPQPNLDAFLNTVKENNLLLYGTSPRGSITLNEVPVDKPFCVLFGNERTGLSPQALKACDLVFRIPMHGFCESFNVSVSAAVVLYELASKRRQLTNGDLTEEQKQEELAKYYLQTIGLEKGRKIVIAKFK